MFNLIKKFLLRYNTKIEKGNKEEKTLKTDLLQIEFLKEQINIKMNQQIG